jgi:hypothetical protein
MAAEKGGSPHLDKLRADAAHHRCQRAAAGRSDRLVALPADERLQLLLRGAPALLEAEPPAAATPPPSATSILLAEAAAEQPRRLVLPEAEPPPTDVLLVIEAGAAALRDRRAWTTLGTATESVAVRARHNALRDKLAQPWDAAARAGTTSVVLAGGASEPPYVSPLRARRAQGGAERERPSPAGKAGPYVSPLRAQRASRHTLSQQRWERMKRDREPIKDPPKPRIDVTGAVGDVRLAGGPSNGMLHGHGASDEDTEAGLAAAGGSTAGIAQPHFTADGTPSTPDRAAAALEAAADSWRQQQDATGSPSNWSEWRWQQTNARVALKYDQAHAAPGS